MASAAIDRLRHEIAELSRQQREVNERLNTLRGGRRGRGGFARGGLGGRGAGRGGRIRKAENELEGPAPKRKLLSAVVKVNGDEVETPSPQPEPVPEGEDQHNDAFQRGKRGNRTFQGYEPKAEPVPRVMPTMDDPNLVKRNRRMFGALLGTLEKFRQEEKQLSSSEALMRRSESLKRAEERAKEESEQLRLQEREHNTESRKRDLILRARLHIKAEEKQYELLLLQWTEHHKRLSGFLKTKAEPPIYYVPVKQTERDKKQLEESEKEFEEWKAKRKEELDEYVKQLSEASMAKAEADVLRIEANRNKRKAQLEGKQNGDDAEADAGEEDEHEEGGRDQSAEATTATPLATVVAGEDATIEDEDDYRPDDDTLVGKQ